MTAIGSDPDEPQLNRFRTQLYTESLNKWFNNPRTATYCWIAFSSIYWTLLVLIPGLIHNELNTYEYYLWFTGMIGICSVYYCTRADYPADSPAGKPIMAMTCIIMSVDWTGHALATFNKITMVDGFIMLGHAISILWASLFFYNRAVKNGKKIAWLSLLLQWIDIVFCCITVFILHSQQGNCLNDVICVGYFIVLVLNLFFWFFPIMFGFSDTEKHIHIHMVILDTFTDLPLVTIIIYSKAYNIHWWMFVDIAFKFIMLVRTYAFHLFINLILRRKELNTLHRQQTAQKELQDRLWDQGATNTEIEFQTMELIKQQTRGIGVDAKMR
eukprot:332106_1